MNERKREREKSPTRLSPSCFDLPETLLLVRWIHEHGALVHADRHARRHDAGSLLPFSFPEGNALRVRWIAIHCGHHLPFPLPSGSRRDARALGRGGGGQGEVLKRRNGGRAISVSAGGGFWRSERKGAGWKERNARTQMHRADANVSESCDGSAQGSPRTPPTSGQRARGVNLPHGVEEASIQREADGADVQAPHPTAARALGTCIPRNKIGRIEHAGEGRCDAGVDAGGPLPHPNRALEMPVPVGAERRRVQVASHGAHAAAAAGGARLRIVDGIGVVVIHVNQPQLDRRDDGGAAQLDERGPSRRRDRREARRCRTRLGRPSAVGSQTLAQEAIKKLLRIQLAKRRRLHVETDRSHLPAHTQSAARLPSSPTHHHTPQPTMGSRRLAPQSSSGAVSPQRRIVHPPSPPIEPPHAFRTIAHRPRTRTALVAATTRWRRRSAVFEYFSVRATTFHELTSS